MHLTLYVAGGTARAERAVRDLEALLAAHGQGQVEVEIVDVVREPARAEAAGILATPTLVRDAPSPTRRVVGDLTDRARVVEALGLDPASSPR